MARKGLSYDMIVQTAAELIEEMGYSHLSLHAIAKKLGVKTASLYNHISSVAQLISGLGHYALDRLDEVLKNAVTGKQKEEALLSLAVCYRAFAKENKELYKAIIRIPMGNDEHLKRSGHKVFHVFYAILDDYSLQDDEKIYFVRSFRSAIHGFITLEEAGFFRKNGDIEKSYTYMLQSYILQLRLLTEKTE